MPRRFVLALVTFALALAPFAPQAAQRAAASTFDVSELRKWQREQLEALADAVARKGNVTLARRCETRLFAIQPFPRDSDGMRRWLERLAKRGLGDAPGLSGRMRAAQEAQFAQLRERIAVRLVAVAREQVPGPGEELAQMLAREAVGWDPENAAARRIVGQRRVQGWGWVANDTADRLEMGEVEVGGEWRPRRGLGEDPRPWGEEWTVRSDHFVLRSNLPLDRVFALRDLLESLRERFLADWEGTLSLRPDPAPHEVLVFAAESEYAAYLREHDPQHVKGVPGQYSPNLRQATFFDVETLRTAGGTTSSLVELMLHECAHQLLHELVDGDPQALERVDAPNHWLNEGLAEYYGMHAPSKQRGLVIDRKAIRGMLRTRHVKENPSLVPSASRLVAMRKPEFQAADGNRRVTHYATAGFLCLFLSRGATRGGWQRLVLVAFTNGNPDDAWLRTMKLATDDLDAPFATFLRSL